MTWGSIDLQCYYLVASKHGMGACQCDSKSLAILSFLKLWFDTNSAHKRQMDLTDSAFASRQLFVWCNEHGFCRRKKRRISHIYDHLPCTKQCIRYFIYNICFKSHYSSMGFPIICGANIISKVFNMLSTVTYLVNSRAEISI